MSKCAVKSTILITGTTGFLGHEIVRQFSNRQCYLRTSGLRTSPPDDLPDYRAVDLCDRAAVSDLVDGLDTVIHAAALTHGHGVARHRDEEYFRVNTAGTESLIRAAAAAQCRRFVLISSISVYGRRKPPFVESAPCFPANAYARSKLDAEKRAAEIAHTAGMDLAILRMAPICGEGSRGNVDRLMRAIDRHRFVWVGAGTNLKSLIHVEDAASACVVAACCDSFPESGVYNVSAPACTMQEIVSALAAALGRRVPPVRLPGRIPLRVIGGASRLPMIGTVADRAFVTLDKWLCDEVYDSSRFREAFAWRPNVDIREALARQATSYRGTISRCA